MGWIWIAGVLSSCNPPAEPMEVLEYQLVRIANRPLPAPMFSGGTEDGKLLSLVVLEATMTLTGDGRYRKHTRAQRTLDGEVLEELERTLEGTYTRTDQRVTVQFVDAQGYPSTFIYDVFDSGRVLRGLESFSWMYEYHRRDPP
jgi:hypothetical protein